MYIDGDTIVKFVGVLLALGTILGLILKTHSWVLEIEKLKKELDEIELKLLEIQKHHDADIGKLRGKEKDEFKEVKDELQLLTQGLLACLKGLREKGADGPVIDAIKMLEQHVIAKAHD